MNKSSKTVSLLILTLLATNILTIEFTNAQTIPTPTVPKFSVAYVNSSIEVTILNQPFNPHQAAGGTTLNLYYTVREKEHSSDNWNYYPQYEYRYYPGLAGNYLASNSDYTTMTFYFNGDDSAYPPLTLNKVLSGEKLDFQVQAAIGFYVTEPYFPPNQSYPPSSQGTIQVFSGYFSDFSNTQSITIMDSDTLPTSTAKPTPIVTPSQASYSPTSPPNTNSELTITLTWIMIGILVISVISLLLYVRHLKRRMPKN